MHTCPKAAILAVAAAAWLSLPAPTQEPAPPEAGPSRPQDARTGVVETSPAASAPAELVQIIQTIGQSDNVGQIASAYARGCTINRNSVSLHEAYMRRMLRLGQTEIAQYPARTLSTLAPANALAWATLAYSAAAKGDLLEGLNLAIRSLEISKEDVSTLSNAGQLAAWYDLSPERPRIADRTRRSLEKMRKDLEQAEPYAKGYAAAKAQCEKLKEQVKDVQGQAASIEADLAAGRTKLGSMEAKLRNINDELRYRKREIGLLRGQLWMLENDTTPTSVYRMLDRQALRDRISDHERQIEGLELDYRKQVREGDALATDLRVKDGQLGQLKRQAANLLSRFSLDFQWEPPAVDGVVTYAADVTPASGPARKPAAGVADDSARQLELAKLYISHEMADKAVPVLQKIIQSAPGSKAAEEARKLLAGLK